jgi:hypothetical protein
MRGFLNEECSVTRAGSRVRWNPPERVEDDSLSCGLAYDEDGS